MRLHMELLEEIDQEYWLNYQQENGVYFCFNCSAYVTLKRTKDKLFVCRHCYTVEDNLLFIPGGKNE